MKMRTYWKAESYKSGELNSINFPERETQAEATCDAEDFLSGLGEFDSRHITAGVVEWESDGESATNTGRFADVTI
jgi:hypothetical protein